MMHSKFSEIKMLKKYLISGDQYVISAKTYGTKGIYFITALSLFVLNGWTFLQSSWPNPLVSVQHSRGTQPKN